MKINAKNKMKKKEPAMWTVLRVKRDTVTKLNYYRARKVEKLGKYMTQNETLEYLLDKAV